MEFGSKKTLALRRDLSMSEDMRDPMRANAGFAANMFKCLGSSLIFHEFWGSDIPKLWFPRFLLHRLYLIPAFFMVFQRLPQSLDLSNQLKNLPKSDNKKETVTEIKEVGVRGAPGKRGKGAVLSCFQIFELSKICSSISLDLFRFFFCELGGFVNIPGLVFLVNVNSGLINHGLLNRGVLLQ